METLRQQGLLITATQTTVSEITRAENIWKLQTVFRLVSMVYFK